MSDEDFHRHRGLVVRIAYDIAGSWADAEDVAQDVYLRWRAAGEVREPRAYLARMAANAALERAEEVELALARVLQRLTPLERAAFLLREVFDFEYGEIAEMLGRTPEAVRQLASRARRHVEAERPGAAQPADPDEVRELAERFARAALGGELDGLVALLADDATLVSDGGGRVRAALRPVEGADRVARFLIGVAASFGEGWRLEPRELNGRFAWLAVGPDGRVDSAYWIEAAGGRIARIDAVRDPRKLEHLAPDGGGPAAS